MIDNDKNSAFQELADRGKSVLIYKRNLQTLATDLFEVIKVLTPDIFWSIYYTRNTSHLISLHKILFTIELKAFKFLDAKFGIHYIMR